MKIYFAAQRAEIRHYQAANVRESILGDGESSWSWNIYEYPETLSLSPDECFRFPRFPGYEATKSHSQRDPERPRNLKRLERERYDLPRITSYQFGLRCCRGIVAASESPERDPWNSRLQDPGYEPRVFREAKNSIVVRNRGCSASLTSRSEDPSRYVTSKFLANWSFNYDSLQVRSHLSNLISASYFLSSRRSETR